MHTVWEIEEGLPQNTVQAVLQTQKGYLWLGTEEGIVRFNGSSFEVFDRTNTPAFDASNSVQTLFEDSQHTLWIGTKDGLISYRQGVFKRYGVQQGLAGKSVSAITEDETGGLWVGTVDAGVFQCETLPCTTFTPHGKLSDISVHALLYDQEQTLWIGSEQGLFSFESNDWSNVTSYNGTEEQRILSLLMDSKNGLWLGTQAGLYRLQGDNLIHVSNDHPALNDGVWSMWEDASGNLWLGMSQNGVIRLRGEHVDQFSQEDRLHSGRILAFYEDMEGSLWIGTDAAGLHRLRDGIFLTITEREGLSNNVVQSVIETPDKSLWIGTEMGLDRWKAGEIKRFTQEDGLSDNFITSIASQRANDIWVGTLNGGLNRIHNNTITQYSTEQGLPSKVVYSLYFDSQNILWIGSDLGLSTWSAGRFTTYTTEDGLSSNFITALLEDRDGTLWIGTYDAGLMRRGDDNVFSTFATEKELSDNLVLALHEDAEGVLWIGTYGGGLSRLKNGKITNYTVEDGLFDNIVFQILEDNAGNLWMGCNKGIYRIAKSQFDAFDAGEIQRLTSISYDKSHGLKSREITGGTQPAGWKGHDGRLWFPTIYGATSVNPAEVTHNPSPSPVVIEQVSVDREAVSNHNYREDTLVLSPGTDRIEFKYAALTSVSPNKVHYRYRLEGYESSWSEIVNYTHAAYTHLDPGTYNFRVIAQNSEGVWNETGASFMFELRPHYYQSPYFWVIVALGVVLLGITVYRWRIEQLTSQHKRLERAVEQRTVDLTQAKEQIETQAEELRSSLKEKEVLLREVHHRVKNNLQVITSLLNLQTFRVKDPETKALFQECHDRVNSMALIHERLYQSDDLNEIDLAKYLENISVELARSYNADRRRIQLNINVEAVRLGLDQAIPSGLIVNELVSNALKHAFPNQASGKIDIDFSRTESTYMLSVSDNGRGLPETFDVKNSASLGIKLVYALTQKLRGTLTVDQKERTRIQIAFPQLQN